MTGQTHYTLVGGPRAGDQIEVWQGDPHYQWTFDDDTADDWNRTWTGQDEGHVTKSIYQLRGPTGAQYYTFIETIHA